MKLPAICTGRLGETHSSLRDIPDRDVLFGPPPNPSGRLADFEAAATQFMFEVSAGTAVPAYNAHQPHVCTILSEQGKVFISDGESRRFGPGDVLFCDDLTGKWHVTRAITDLAVAFVHRAASQGS